MKIICVGKKHDRWIIDGISRYERRLRAPFKLDWQFVSYSSFSGDRARRDESTELLKRIAPQDYIILLDETGKNIDSPSLSHKLEQLTIQNQIVFIIGGAFSGIEEIIKRRLGEKVIGFSKSDELNDTDAIISKVKHEDLVKFGIIPEFIGRIPVICYLEELNENDLVRVLTEPKNSVIKQYQYLFSLDNVDLIFEKDALVEIARESIKRKTGARGLRSIIEELLLDVMYDIPSKENIKTCTITRENVLNKTKPLLK